MVVNACSGLDMEPGMNYNCHICFIGEDAGKEPGLGFLNRMICGWRHMIVWQKSYWRRRWLRLYRSHMVKIRYVEEQEGAPVDRTGNLRTEPAADGGWQQREAPLEGRRRKEGVTIILDKGSVSIFRMEEHMETGSD